ncbi:MAG: RES family NAD+ phosphorylase [Lachnospiraceae bacterium]|nr:RES family NAD+ phosphorylase [Lachnospiraceae bacterium]
MICCANCFSDIEIKAVIDSIGRVGDCPVCGAKNVSLYDSDADADESEFEELLSSIIEIYQPDDLLGKNVPSKARKPIELHIAEDWNLFNVEPDKIKSIISFVIQNSLTLDQRLLTQKCAIKELFDEQYMSENSIMGSYSWEDFKIYMRNQNRFHSRHVHLDIFAKLVKDTETILPRGEKYYRARIASDRVGHKRKNMGAPPKDVATAGRVNSKGVSCLYLADKKETTVKEIRAGAFDYVTIATFRLKRDVKVLDLSSITHNSPFYAPTDKKYFYINERHLKKIAMDIAKPMSSHDSDLEYLPTQYISDFAKFLGYDGVKYISTFDKSSYNLALFDVDACDCIYHRTYRIGNLNYELIPG